MKSNPRRSIALHVLAHLAERRGLLRTSKDLARRAHAEPVAVRRTVAVPRGGWRLARETERISVEEVRDALGERLDRLSTAEVRGVSIHSGGDHVP